jgi:AraC-like DNA-binding protein
MKALPFRIPKNTASSFRIQIDQEAYFYDRLHYHPEWQITLIEKGSGTLFIGDGIHRFQPGDLFVVGSNLPHLLKSDELYYSDDSPGTYALSLFFDEHSFGNGFFDLPELRQVKDFLASTSRGIRFLSPGLEELEDKIRAIHRKTDFRRLLELFDILEKLSQWPTIAYLSHSSFTEAQKESDGNRLNEVFQYTLRHYSQNISLEEIADVANMSIPAFCRYFKLHTRKSYIRFLNEVRINIACQLLKESRQNISQICFEVGFQNLSNFNRQFKKVMGRTPSRYRELSA